jgi:transposase
MTRTFEGLVVGLDVGDRTTAFHIVDATGETVGRGTFPTREHAFAAHFQHRPCLRLILEVGTHSPWLSRLLESWGHEVIVANPHRLRLIAQSVRKNDRADAETLARVGRLDIALLSPVHHRSAEAQADLAVLRSRAALVAVRSRLVNEARATVKSIGGRLPSCSPEAFPHVAFPWVPEALLPALRPLFETIASLTSRIREMDRELASTAARYPAAAQLQQVPGVGPVTALTFVLTLDDPHRFPRSRDVGAYLGLVPKQRQSGDRELHLGITKAGDRMLRSLLVQCAHYVLGYRGPDCDLRRWGLAHVTPGAASQKKRVVVAVARKLAVLLHRLWVSGAVYRPLRQEEPAIA